MRYWSQLDLLVPADNHKIFKIVAKKSSAIQKYVVPPSYILGDFSIPKITPPRPARLFSRLRLFELLDRFRERDGLIWVSAPAGAGKTSLAASYIAARELPTLWYQVDSGDGDIASFFFYLGLATARIAPQHEQPMPVLNPEYLGDLPTFARNYFREFYRRLPRGCVIVLDNFQIAPLHSPLHELLPVMLQELPQDLNLAVLSREYPPATLARLRLGGKVNFLDAAQLRLTIEESQGMSEIHLGDGQPDLAILRQMHEQTQGWAAGLVVLLEQTLTGSVPNPTQSPVGRELLFDFFAGEVFARFTIAEQDFLLKTALFTKVTVPAARELSGNPQAAAILDNLTQRNYFTVRQAESYEYHPLFREFLITCLRRDSSPAELAELQRRAAVSAAAGGQLEDAVQLWIDAGAWKELIAALLTIAPALITHGRWKTLVEWIECLPAPVREVNSDVAYWFGIAWLPFDPSRARASLEFAYREFKRVAAVESQWRAWCGVVDSYVFEWRDFHPLGEWIAEVENELGQFGDNIPEALNAHIASGMFMALMNHHPQHPDMERWAQRAWDLAIGGNDPVLCLKTGPHLLLYYTWWIGDLPKAELLLNALRPYTENPEAPPLAQITWCAMAGGYYWMNAENQECIATVERGLGLADATGVHVWDTLLCSHGMFAALTSGQIELAQVYEQRMVRLQDPTRTLDSAAYYYLSGYLRYSRGDRAAALEHVKTGVSLAEAAGAVYQTGIFHNEYGRMLFYAGDTRGANAMIEQGLATSQELRSLSMEYLCYLAQAEIALQCGEEKACRMALTSALQIGRQQGFRNHTWWDAELMVRLYAKALEHSIEVPYVREQIRIRALTPSLAVMESLDAWPWPLRLYTLGRFSIVRDGQPLANVVGKGHKKPLEMLQTLIAMGGRQVGVEHVIEHLWSDAEGDAAANNFKITLHRLRKLLVHESAIEFTEGRLTINPSLVWIDSVALTRALCETQNGDSLKRALALYQGHYLKLEPANNSAIIHYRENLGNRMLGALKTQIEYFEKQQNWEAVLDYSTRAIALDDIDEDFYSATIRAHLARGRKAEAQRAYEQAKQRYAQLGLKPSPHLQALLQVGA